MSFTGRSLHFVGIGGAGMSGLALVSHALGARVTGSDRVDSPACDSLRAAGIEPAIGHDAANYPAGAELVVSTAIPDDNPELSAARAAGATVLHRGDLLGELSAMKRTIAVSGTHGKTTTASMAAHVLRESGRDPAFLIGGELRSAATNAAWGEGEWAGIEAGDVRAGSVELLPGGSRFEVDGTPVELRVPGRHNVLNALAALAACRAAGVEPPEAAAPLRRFTGAGRR